MASGKWKLQTDDKGTVLLGTLEDDLKYHWIDPIYIPSVLLDCKWHEVERSEEEAAT